MSQGKVSEKSGNLDMDIEWQPCHNLCFEQKYENKQKISTEHCHFYSREKIAVCCMGGFS